MGQSAPSFPEHYLLVPAAEIEARLARLSQALGETAALVSWPADLFYLSGTNQQAYLFLAPGRRPVLLVKRSPQRARAESPVAVEPLDSFRDLGRLAARRLGGPAGRLALTLDTLPYREAQAILELLGRPEPVDLSPLLLAQRAVKSDWEQAQMVRAGEIGRRVYAELPALFKPGMSELALAGALTAAAMAAGSQPFMRTRQVAGEMYPYHLVAGSNGLRASRVEAPFGGLGLSPSFPQGPSLEPIRPGQGVVVDFGTCWLGYQVDVTRMFAWGAPAEESLRAYRALQAIQADLLSRLVPGADGQELYQAALAKAAELGFAQEFLGQGRSRIKFVGHGVGLEISEPPYLAEGRPEILQADQTLALELKMVLPGREAVGLENTLVVTPAGGRIITPAEESFGVLGG